MDKPFSIQVEMVEGCTRLCPFCGLNAIRDAPGGYKRMSLHTAELAAGGAAELNPNMRVEFAMHGEPLVHPDAVRIIGMFRAAMPKTQIQVTTNGATLRKDTMNRVMALFKAGADFLVVDTYRPERDELRAALLSLRPDVDVLDFYDDIAPKGFSIYSNHRRKFTRKVVMMDDIGERDGEHATRVLLNHAGSNPMKPPLKEPKRATCTNPFREVTVAWNGNVNICCMDWKHEYVCGNVHERTMKEIWFGPEFQAARRMLEAKDRNFSPCAKCDKGAGTRPGLLPKVGQVTEEDRETIRRVTKPKVRLGLARD